MPHAGRVLVVPPRPSTASGDSRGFPGRRIITSTVSSAPGSGNSGRGRRWRSTPAFKQIIPYVIFRSGGLVFCYRRGTSQGEARLHRLRSLGVGGHVDEPDADGRTGLDAYDFALRREIEEEVAIGSPGSMRLVGLINDDETPVGRVHLGVVHVYELDSPLVSPREDGLADAGFLPIADLPALRDEFETWSRFCIESVLA